MGFLASMDKISWVRLLMGGLLISDWTISSHLEVVVSVWLLGDLVQRSRRPASCCKADPPWKEILYLVVNLRVKATGSEIER